MCGRYVSPDEAAIERAWHIGARNNNPFRRLFNAASTMSHGRPTLIQRPRRGDAAADSPRHREEGVRRSAVQPLLIGYHPDTVIRARQNRLRRYGQRAR